MNNNKRINFIMAIVVVLIIGISIGYAALSASLNIIGGSKIKKSSWDIHFKNLHVKEGSVEATSPAVIKPNKIDINYSISLEKPGDFYEFSVVVVNDGTIDAKLSADPTLSGLTPEQKVYSNYTVTYNDGSPVAKNDKLKAGAEKTLKVRVEYKKDITPEQLPSETQEVTLTFAMNYIQD